MLCTAVYYLHQIDEGLFLYFFFRLLRRYTSFTLFPYTTLFRSQIFHKELSIPQTLKQSMEYSLRAGGKRIRPMLLLADRKSTRLNSSHVAISYAVFCLKKKNKQDQHLSPTLQIYFKCLRQLKQN